MQLKLVYEYQEERIDDLCYYIKKHENTGQPIQIRNIDDQYLITGYEPSIQFTRIHEKIEQLMKIWNKQSTQINDQGINEEEEEEEKNGNLLQPDDITDQYLQDTLGIRPKDNNFYSLSNIVDAIYRKNTGTEYKKNTRNEFIKTVINHTESNQAFVNGMNKNNLGQMFVNLDAFKVFYSYCLQNMKENMYLFSYL